MDRKCRSTGIRFSVIRKFPRLRFGLVTRFAERKVSRAQVAMVDATTPDQFIVGRRSLRPVASELFLLLNLPFFPNVIREILSFIERRFGKVEDVRLLNNRQFDDLQFVIPANETGHGAVSDRGDVAFPQSQVSVQFRLVQLCSFDYLQCC